MAQASVRSRRALEAANFFLADVQTGLGPFLAAYLASAGWRADRIGTVLTLSGLLGVILQTPAGGIVDRARHKRALLIGGTIVLAMAATLLALSTRPLSVYAAQVATGAAGPFLGPTLAAITLGLVGASGFDRQFGRNQGFNAAGNLAAAGVIAGTSLLFGERSIFACAALLAVPTILSVLLIRSREIDYEESRGGEQETTHGPAAEKLTSLLKSRPLLIFIACAAMFHMANAAMLPQLGELLARHQRHEAAPFMSACISVTQLTIMVSAAFVGRMANRFGRKPLLLIGYGVLPVRGLLYTLVHGATALIAVQLLDGVANAIFGVVSVLVVSDCTRGTGRFNLAQGMLATAIGIGASASTTLGGALITHGSFNLSFLTLGGVALAAFLVLVLFMPETLASTSTEKRRTQTA